MKYIIFKNLISNIYEPVIFPEHTNHCDIIVRHCMAKSAGFFAINKGSLELYGRSDSLNLDVNPELDRPLLKNLLNNYGIYGFFEKENMDT